MHTKLTIIAQKLVTYQVEYAIQTLQVFSTVHMIGLMSLLLLSLLAQLS